MLKPVKSHIVRFCDLDVKQLLERSDCEKQWNAAVGQQLTW